MMRRHFRYSAGLTFCLLLLFSGSLALAEDTVCLQCHAALEGRLSAPVSAWQTSIHAQNGISCPDCHGGDPTDFAMAMSPARGFLGVPKYGEVPAFCGRCHVGVKDDYLNSAHGKALNSGGPQCVSCHGNHGVQQASLELINPTACSRCHEFGRAAEIKTAMGETDRMIAGLRTELASLARLGIRVREIEGEAFALRNDSHRLFHTVEVEKVRKETAAFQQRGDGIGGEIGAIQDELGDRKLIGVGVVGMLLLISIICFLIRKTYQQDEDAQRQSSED